MFRIAVVVYVFFLINSVVDAREIINPYSSRCEQNGRFDSYGRGIGAAFSKYALTSRDHDQLCFELGFEIARDTQKSRGPSCITDYKAGYGEGLKASVYSAGVPCYNLGYTSGLGDLGTAAREGFTDVSGPSCIAAYKKGKLGIEANNLSSQESYCYQLGTFDHRRSR